MNSSELAKKMLEWEKLKHEIHILEQEIKNTVLRMGKSQCAGNVKATFNKGRRTFDYKSACIASGKFQPDLENDPKLETYKKTRVSISYRTICEVYEIVNIPSEQSEPSVKLKVVKKPDKSMLALMEEM
jgi:hypothetical protein